ncbi:MAG: Tfp pilus assembly protein PilX [Planctomycetota bacterium]|jgi:Tfp pilus assembly protein PilX
MNLAKKQSGTVLFIALIFLVIMTLYAVSSINMSTTNLKIVGNMQAIKEMDADAQDAIEQTLSDMNQFSLTPAASTVSGAIGSVDVATPECIQSRTATGYSAVAGDIIPEDNTWELTATVSDSVTGAASTIHQGVEIRMLAGNCP